MTVRALSADTITCEAVCTNTVNITFSSNIPEANNLRTCGGQSTPPTLNANAGTMYAVVNIMYYVMLHILLRSPPYPPNFPTGSQG